MLETAVAETGAEPELTDGLTGYDFDRHTFSTEYSQEQLLCGKHNQSCVKQ